MHCNSPLTAAANAPTGDPSSYILARKNSLRELVIAAAAVAAAAAASACCLCPNTIPMLPHGSHSCLTQLQGVSSGLILVLVNTD